MTAQMQAGRIFMDSLTDADIQKWIIRADTLLADQALNSQQVVNIPVPKNLSALKIGRIDVSVPDYVAFIWVGGMDHTGLIIQKDANGSHRVIARYDDEHEKQLWPKENTNNVQ
jgi:hypothetical protein